MSEWIKVTEKMPDREQQVLFITKDKEMFVGANVLQIPEGGGYEAQNLILTQMFNRSRNVHITTKAPLLGMCCYKPFFFTNFK